MNGNFEAEYITANYREILSSWFEHPLLLLVRSSGTTYAYNSTFAFTLVVMVGINYTLTFTVVGLVGYNVQVTPLGRGRSKKSLVIRVAMLT